MEFSLTATAVFSDAHRVDVLAEVMEHLDLNDAQEAAAHLQMADVQRAWQMDSQLSGDHSDNNSEDWDGELDDEENSGNSCAEDDGPQTSGLAERLCSVFIYCYEDSIDDLTLTPNPDKQSVRIEAEGRDNEANDFVVVLAQLLVAAGARSLTIRADSECWRGTWRVNHDEIDVNVSPLE